MGFKTEQEQLKDFGLWLTKRRESCGYKSQRRLAIRADVSTSTISRVEAGIQKAKPETLAKLAPYLKISHKELMIVAEYLDPEPVPKEESPEQKRRNKIEEVLAKIFSSAARGKGEEIVTNELIVTDELIDEVDEFIKEMGDMQK